MESDKPEKKTEKEIQHSHLSPITTALFIGFLFGVVVYSVAVNSWGIFTLIPLYFIYRLLKDKSKNE